MYIHVHFCSSVLFGNFYFILFYHVLSPVLEPIIVFAMGYVAYLLADAIALSGIIRFVCVSAQSLSAVYSTYPLVCIYSLCMWSM